jgi:hypothetical protein
MTPVMACFSAAEKAHDAVSSPNTARSKAMAPVMAYFGAAGQAHGAVLAGSQALAWKPA